MDVKLILENSIERVDKIEKAFTLKNGYSNVLLFKEFIRRLSNCKGKFSINFYLPLVKDKVEGVDSSIDSMLGGKKYEKFGNAGYLFIYTFLYWEVYKHFLPFNLSPELADLYEPLIKIFERGGYITREGNIFDICHMEGFSLNTAIFSEKPIIADFSDEGLDIVDNEFLS